jgi:peroxiredoxin
MAKTFSNQTLKIGERAPTFELKGVDNNVYSLTKHESECILVVFMCNHCPYVRARIRDISGLQQRFSSKELQIIGINSNDPDYDGEGFDNMVVFAKKNELNFPYVIDDTQQIARMYGATCTPDPFLFDSQLRLVFHGRINDATEPDMQPTDPVMEKNIRRILNGEKVEKAFDPSVGCSIKWKD